MTKGELIDALSKVCCSKKEAGDCLDKFIEIITNKLKNKDSVQITGFGTFSVSHRKARQGVNPRTGEKINIPAMNLPKFKPGKQLKEAVR